MNDKEILAISTWARNGTPKGDPADAPESLVFDDSLKWTAGEPDLIVRTNSVTKLAGTADWWGEIDRVPVDLEEDRYVKSVEIVEVNDVNNTTGTETTDSLNKTAYLRRARGFSADSAMIRTIS